MMDYPGYFIRGKLRRPAFGRESLPSLCFVLNQFGYLERKCFLPYINFRTISISITFINSENDDKHMGIVVPGIEVERDGAVCLAVMSTTLTIFYAFTTIL